MFSSKQSVDRHVSNILGRIRDEKERNNRGYQIARLYLEVKEYELAKRYVAGFLSVKEGFAPAHKLLGQILEGLNQVEKAVTAYKRSLEIDDRQKDVVLKICELYLQTDIDPERAKYWAERAEKVWPHHDTVFKLREKIYTEREGDKNTDDLENLIASELVKRPKDPKLRAKLMRLYIDTGRINEAYEHAVGVEKKAAYPSSLEWYQCLQDIFQVYQEETGGETNGAFHQNLLLAQCFLTSLTMEQSKVADVADALHKFDQTIESARKVTGGDDWNIVYREMQAQLYFLAGTLLLKRAQQDHLGWMEATQMASACYISSYAYEPPHTKTPWYAKAKEEDKKVFDRLRLLANFRASQTGHMMKQMCKGDSQKWISSLKESHFGEKGRGRLYETLFTLRHLKGSKSSSYLYQGSALSSLLCVYPTDAQLKEYDKECHLLHANSLHHLIWIALEYYSVRDRTQPNYNFSVFDDLQYSVTNLQLASPESLCQIDTQIFLWAATRTTALHQQEHQRAAPANGDKPSVLPVLINERLCTVEQDQWWNTAYQLFKNTAKENLGKLRLVLQRGIETVRLCKNHGMDVSLVVHIGRTFEERVEELKAKSHSAYDYSNEIDHLHNRAVQYWREACDILEKFQRNQNLPSPKQKLFSSYEASISDKQMRDLLEEGKFFLACDAMKQGEDELAVEEFDKLNMADASYYQAQILRKMADEAISNVTRGQEEQADEQEEALLIRARDALYLTMDRTRDNKHHKLAPHLATELDEIESRLNRLNSNKTVNDSQRSDVREESSAMVDMNVSSKALATPSAQSTPHPKARPKVNISIGNSPQKQFHAQPSPERLDAQIRSLSFSQDTLIKQLMERNEELVKQNAAILAELSASRKLIEKLMTARPIDPTAAYPVVMPAAAASPLHHPSLAPHAAAQSPLGPHAASTPPRHVQPVPPGAASPFYGSPYRLHPEYEYAAAYSPHAGYPIYPQGAAPAPPLQHYPAYQDPASQPHAAQPHAAGPVPKAVPVGTLAGSAGKEPSAAGPVKSSGTHAEEEDYEDYYYEDGSDEEDDDEGDIYQVSESQLIQDWPYGNSVSISGKSTINYSPQRNQQQFPGQPTTYYGQGPASTGLPMPGPGFFSSPERPTGAYNAGRYIPPGGIDTVSTQLHPPRPGFIGTIGSPVSNAQTPPRAAVADKAGGVVSGRSPAQTGTNTTEAALTGGSLIKMPQPPQVSAATKFAIPISSGIFSGSTDMNAAIAAGSPITTVTGVGMTSKDVQPKSPGVNDEDDDEGAAGDDSYQGPDFEPIIPLPEEVEVKTGEEEEKVLFVARSRLYIFIENQWKERGTGDIKILWKEETGQARVVMRRDQVLKVCANHYIMPNMKIDLKSEKEAKILTWIAMDFSEEEGAMQKFSCRFKTEGIAAEFKAKFEEAMELCAKQVVKKEDKGAVKKKDDGVDLLAKLKPKPGSWNCEACYVNNPPEVIACVACTTPKPGAELKTPQQKSIFGAGNATTGVFNAVTTKASASGFTFGSPVTKPTNTSFTFGQTPPTTQDTKSKASFTFGTPSSSTSQTGFKFGSATSDNPATSSGFKFGTSTVVTTTTNVSEAKSTPAISPPKFTFNKPVPSTTTTPAADALKLMASKADSSESSDKPTFGGFTFTSKPLVTEKKEEVTKKEEKESEAVEEEEAPKANPFASFSFSSTKTVNKPAESKSTEGMTFGTAAASNLDFASLVTEDAKAFTKKSDFKGFEGAGAKLFEGSKDEAADESGHADDYEPDVDFKPIIPLPDLVEVKTGEEEEEKLFGNRAKLYRHDNETKQWKERGLGEIKILKHKETGRCRVLMRREQVLKLCANHYITAEMSLNPLKTSDRAWCWYASDYSEDEMKYEQLAVKFKSGDVAEKFKDIFEKCQKDIREKPTVTDAENVGENKNDKGTKSQNKSQPSLGEMFKPKIGQWDCQICYVRNDANLIICAACQTPKPGHEGEAAKQKASEPKKDPFSGGFKIADGAVQSSGQSSGQVFTFGVSAANKKPDETPPKTGFLFGMPTSPKAASFSFTTASTPVSATTAESSGTPFNLSSSGFKFGTSPSTDATKTPNKESGTTKTFGLSTGGFTFTPTTTPAKQDKLKSPQSPDGDYYVNTDDEDSHIYFEPIVQLPEKVDLVTGEEDEEPLYCHRAKLFRYDDNQWKERGLGDIKILRHKQTKKCRLVMRREQILKICLNHMISDVLNLQPMQNSQGKAWVWVATDFAEGEPSDEKIAIKFKTAEIANEFKNAFDDAKQGKGKVLDLPPTPIKVRERTDSSSRDSTRERKDSARERKDSAKERERRHSAGKSESPDKVKATTNLESFSFKPQSTSASETSTSTPKVSFAFGSSDSQVSSVFGGSSTGTAVPRKFTFGSGASISSGFNFGTTSVKLESAASPSGAAGKSGKTFDTGTSLLAQMLMSDDPIDVPDLEITYEKKPSKEQADKAAEFKLPSTFYNYEDAKPCPGCRGCEDDDDYHKDVIFVKEEMPSSEQVVLAQKYMLPKSFFLYENKAPCRGCLGCYDDLEGIVYKDKPLATEGKGESQKEIKGDEAKGTKNDIGSNAPVFGGKTSSEFSFAAIAAKSPPSAFTFGSKTTSDKPFSFAGSGTQLFRNLKSGEDDDGNDDETVQNEDIHFEPIVHLEEVEVKTGEEEETAIYSQRSKLFRFTDGQWKERGIGDMKILKHNSTGRFRLLMRRDQILKICCNHQITADLELRPMNTSEVAWCWFAMDFTDGQPVEEQFALKFKNQELARLFKEKVTECQQLLKQVGNSDVPVVDTDADSNEKADDENVKDADTSVASAQDSDHSYSVSEADKSGYEKSEGEAEYSGYSQSGAEGGNDDDEYVTDEEEEMQLLFSKRATMLYEDADHSWKQIGMGDLQVVYDDDVNGNRIRMTKDNGALICNHIICKDYQLQCNEKKKFVEWTAKDFSTDEPIKRTFRVQFSSKNAVAEFKAIFAEGLELAKEWDIREVTEFVPTPIFSEK